VRGGIARDSSIGVSVAVTARGDIASVTFDPERPIHEQLVGRAHATELAQVSAAVRGAPASVGVLDVLELTGRFVVTDRGVLCVSTASTSAFGDRTDIRDGTIGLFAVQFADLAAIELQPMRRTARVAIRLWSRVGATVVDLDVRAIGASSLDDRSPCLRMIDLMIAPAIAARLGAATADEAQRLEAELVGARAVPDERRLFWLDDPDAPLPVIPLAIGNNSGQ
jgi:hypothetical protein